MEINGQIARAEQLMPSLQNSLPTNSLSSNNHSISVYQDNNLDKRVELDCVVALKKTFPALPIGFYDILHDRLVANEFTSDRLKDAIANVIDTCMYPTPTIANIISWDKRVKLYTYADVCDHVDKGGSLSDFHKRTIKDRIYWISNAEATRYGLKIG